MAFLSDLAGAPQAAIRILSWLQVSPTYQGITLILIIGGIALIGASQLLPAARGPARVVLDPQAALSHRCINVVMIPSLKATLAEVKAVFLSPHEVTSRTAPLVILLILNVTDQFQELCEEAQRIPDDSHAFVSLLRRFIVLELPLVALLERRYAEVPRLLEDLDALRRRQAHVQFELGKVSTSLVQEASSEVVETVAALRSGRLPLDRHRLA